MPSLRSRLLLFIMKNSHLLQFQLKKKNVDWNTNESILRFREQCEKGAKRFGKIPPGIEVMPAPIDGLPAEWIMPSQATNSRSGSRTPMPSMRRLNSPGRSFAVVHAPRGESTSAWVPTRETSFSKSPNASSSL